MSLHSQASVSPYVKEDLDQMGTPEASPSLGRACSSHFAALSHSVQRNIPGRAQENMHTFDSGWLDLCPLHGLSEHRSWGAEAVAQLWLSVWLRPEVRRSRRQPAVRLGPCERTTSTRASFAATAGGRARPLRWLFSRAAPTRKHGWHPLAEPYHGPQETPAL